MLTMYNLSSVKLKNVMCQDLNFAECYIAYWMWRTVPFALVVIGTFGNVISLIVISRPALRHYSTSVYLMVLAVSDFLVLYFVVLRETVYAMTGRRFADASWLSCKAIWWFAYTAAGSSVAMLVVLTCERVLMIKAPLYLRNKLTSRNAIIVTSVTLAFVVVLNSHMLFGFDLFDPASSDDFLTAVTETDLNVHPCYYKSQFYKDFFTGTWSVVVLAFCNVCPIIVIFIGNIVIARGIIRRQRAVNPTELSCTHSSSNQTTTGTTERKTRKSFARILLVLSCFFLVTTLPYCVYVVIKNQLTLVSARTVARLQLIEVCVHCLMYANFSLNFMFYFLSGTLFRKTLKSLIESAKKRFC